MELESVNFISICKIHFNLDKNSALKNPHIRRFHYQHLLYQHALVRVKQTIRDPSF